MSFAQVPSNVLQMRRSRRRGTRHAVSVQRVPSVLPLPPDYGALTLRYLVGEDGTVDVSVRFDVDHPRVRRMVKQAIANQGRKSREVSGALTVTLLSGDRP